MVRLIAGCLACAMFSAATEGHAVEPSYDVVVYGGTSAGVAAAVQTRRMGKSVVLIEPGRIEYEELDLWAPETGVPDAGGLEVCLRLLYNVPRVPTV